MTTEGNLKTCFVIAPIGEERSEIRGRSDKVLTHIIRPITKNCGYNSIRADEVSQPGVITSQIIQHIIDDDLVIADLTGRNPNVFYELAVRHAIKKPVIQIIQSGESIPFDVAQTRTIQFDPTDMDSVANCKKELEKQIKATEQNSTNIDSPISMAIKLQVLGKSDNPLEKSNAEIISMLQDVKIMIGKQMDSSGYNIINREKLDDSLSHLDEAITILSKRNTALIRNKKVLEALYHLHATKDSLLRLSIIYETYYSKKIPTDGQGAMHV
jgi:hypothetical protein